MNITLPQLFTELAQAAPQTIRGSILALQTYLAHHADAATEEVCQLKHVFAPGNYAREITMPAGLVVIGKLHRHSHLNVISKGRVQVLTENGVVHMQAPCTFTSPAGTKRVVLVLEETVWTTVHPTDETDLDKIEDYVIAQDYSELEIAGECAEVEDIICLGGQ